jgi:hypothetical protein
MAHGALIERHYRDREVFAAGIALIEAGAVQLALRERRLIHNAALRTNRAAEHSRASSHSRALVSSWKMGLEKSLMAGLAS